MKIIGIDIGGTKCGVILAEYKNEQVNFIDKSSFLTSDFSSPSEIIAKLIEITSKIIDKTVISIGINCGGPLNTKQGIILCPPNLKGWINIPIVKYFKDSFNIPCYLQNDANAGAIAEYLFGVGKGCENIIFLTHGTGMGAGLILNGKLYSGTNDMAGEVGHIRLERFGPVGFGKAGSFEGFCSGGGIARLAQQMIIEKLQIGEVVNFCEKNITTETLANAAKNGDKLALEVFEISGKYLGRAIALLIDILNPELILLGSIYKKCGDLLEPSMIREIKKEAILFSQNVCKIKACGLGDSINDYEAVSIAIYNELQLKC